MITRGWAFKVWGDPQPKGSMKCIGARGKVKHQLVEDNDDSPAWREKVAAVAKRVVQEQADEYQPISVELCASVERPASHYGTGRNRWLVKSSSPVWPTLFGTGDTDKLARLVLDALEDAKILRNDAQARRVLADKWYAGPNHHPILSAPQIAASDVLERPGVVVRIRPISG